MQQHEEHDASKPKEVESIKQFFSKITYLNKTRSQLFPLNRIGSCCVTMTISHFYKLFQRYTAVVVQIVVFKVSLNFSGQKF